MSMGTPTRHIVVGIDPGKNTGYAKWDANTQCMLSVETSQIHRVMHDLREGWQAGWLAYVIFEDARLRTHYGTERGTAEDDARKQGAGSIRRDCTILQAFLHDMGIPWVAVSPKQKGGKVDDVALFARLTQWTKRTSQHGRDAAILVVGARATVPPMLSLAALTKTKAKPKPKTDSKAQKPIKAKSWSAWRRQMAARLEAAS